MSEKELTKYHDHMCIPWVLIISPNNRPYSVDGITRTFKVCRDDIKYCCDDMEKNSGQSGYYPIYITTSDYTNQWNEVETEYCATIISNPEFEHGEIDYQNNRINFCPFCGKPIKSVKIKTLEKVLKECKEVIKKEPVYETREVKQ